MEPRPQDRERRVLDALHRAAVFCDRRIGWNRIGVALSVTIITIAAVALYRILRTINPREVIEALVTADVRDITLAAVFVAGGYLTLTFYDLFALRTIDRKDVPYWAAALAAFTSYAVGHNVGASVFTGGAVRYRIYSAWGLSAIEVAKICFVAGLTFWLGNATVLGLGILYAPLAATAIDQLPAWLNRAGAVLILIVLALYVGWVWRRPRVVGREGWCVNLPGGPLTLLQIGIGIVDLGFCALAMYMLVPDEPQHRLRHAGRDLRLRHAARLCEPCARRYRRLRRGHVGGAVAVRQGRRACWRAPVPPALLHRSVRAFAPHSRRP
jgi:glycosyltransferase 2 family protein